MFVESRKHKQEREEKALALTAMLESLVQMAAWQTLEKETSREGKVIEGQRRNPQGRQTPDF